MDGVAAAEVNLDEVEAQLLEEEVGILLVVLVESDADTRLVTAVIAAAGVVTGVAVDAGFQAFGVDVVDDRLQTVGEPLRVYQQLARLLVAPAEVAVIDVDVVVTGIEQFLRHH